MVTRRGGGSRSRTSAGGSRQAGRVPRNRLEKIPIPPVPAFLQSSSRAPEKKHEPGHDRLAEIISRNAISDEEADLLLGVSPAAGAGRPWPAPGQSLDSDTGDAPATAPPEGALTEDEADDLLGLAPGPAVRTPDTSPPAALHDPSDATARSGASGAAVLNELVDEIEKDLERVLERQAPAARARRYGRTIGCWVSPLADASHLHPLDAARMRDEEEGAP